MQHFQVHTPQTRDELIESLKAATAKSKILAGGTDLVIALREGRVEPDLVIDLSGMDELKTIREENGWIAIGSMTTLSDIKNSRLIQERAACLAKAAATFGSTQVRNLATLGGNIASASPAADSLPPLLVLEAEVDGIDGEGQNFTIPAGLVSAGVNKNNLKAGQVITRIRFPLPESSFLSTFIKLGARSSVTIARIGLALGVNYDPITCTICAGRVSLGAVGIKPFRAQKIEQLLTGQGVTPGLAEKFATGLSQEVEEAIPGRYSLPYKKEAVMGVAHQAFTDLFPTLLAGSK